MPVKAPISMSAYLWRPGVFAALCLVFSAFFLYDGFVKYPRQRAERDAFTKFMADGHAREDWPKYAAEHGLPLGTEASDPGEARSDTDILLQRGLGFAVLPIGLYFAGVFFSSLGRWVAADETGLTTSGGKTVPYDAVVTLNKRRWRTKGIAVLTYRDAAGEGKLTLDNWKYELEPMNELVRAVESKLRPDQIAGEAPAAPPLT